MASKIAQDIPVVAPSVAMDMIRAMIHAGSAAVPIFLWGAPGVGKSSLVREVAEEEGVDFIDLRLVQLDPVDLRGLPYVQTVGEGDGEHRLMKFAEPGLLPREGKGVLFLDELPQAQPLVQNAASELVLDRRIGDYRLPDGWIIVAAGNRRQDRAATSEIPAHLKNRFSHVEVQPRFDDWKAWAETTTATKCGAIEPRLLAFLSSNQSRLNAFNPDQVASPTSRTWEFVSRIMHLVKDKRARNALIGGCVGKGMEAEVRAFLSDDDDMPTLEQIIQDYNKAPVPETNSGQAAVAENLGNQANLTNIDAIAGYLNRLNPESAMIAIVEILGGKNGKKMLESPTMNALAKRLGVI